MPAPGRALTAPSYVDTDEGLRRLAQRLLGERAIAVDTESNSLFAHRERLCLIQVSSAHGDFLVDPLAIRDLSPLVPVFAGAGIVKVFHDAEYDIIALKRAHPFEFASVFDTKVAAMSLGRHSLGLAAALSEHFGVQLDKRLQRSDWGHRPLSDEQKEYARLDTHYLTELAQRLRTQLIEAGEIHVLEVASECRRLMAQVPPPRTFDPDGYATLRGVESLDPAGRRRLRELFGVRERIAADRDLPPFKVLHNDTLVEIARRAPQSAADLHAVPGLFPKLIERFGGAVLSALRRAERLRPIEDLPRCENDGALRLSPAQRRVHERLRTWRKSAAAARRVDASLVLPRGVLEALATARPRPRDTDGLLACGLLEPWRVAHYGAGILAALG
ncbi:MAG: HRDC domain-containing protein [Planctomycetota bacterium]